MKQVPDLNALANSGSFGTAQIALARAGFWDEYAGLQPREYRVKVSYEIRHEATEIVTITARCEAEASEIAEQKIEDAHEFDVEFTHVEVLA